MIGFVRRFDASYHDAQKKIAQNLIGKSTLLNAIAGFAPPTSGSITADGQLVTGPGPERGMVFQEYALFPWMTVADNIGFGLEIKGVAKPEIAAVVDKLLKMLSLQDFRDRYPSAASACS